MSAENGAAVYVVDTTRHEVVERIVLAPDTLKPMGIVPAPDGTAVYVTRGRGGTLEVTDAASYAVRASGPVGERPVSIFTGRGRSFASAWPATPPSFSRETRAVLSGSGSNRWIPGAIWRRCSNRSTRRSWRSSGSEAARSRGPGRAEPRPQAPSGAGLPRAAGFGNGVPTPTKRSTWRAYIGLRCRARKICSRWWRRASV